jgi:putative hemolysin
MRKTSKKKTKKSRRMAASAKANVLKRRYAGLIRCNKKSKRGRICTLPKGHIAMHYDAFTGVHFK